MLRAYGYTPLQKTINHTGTIGYFMGDTSPDCNFISVLLNAIEMQNFVETKNLLETQNLASLRYGTVRF